MQPRTHRADRAAQGHGRIGVIYFLQVAQHHHLAISPGQRMNGAAQGVETLAAGQIE